MRSAPDAQTAVTILADPSVTAQLFSGIRLWIPSNHVMFKDSSAHFAHEDLKHFIALGVSAFVAAYRPENKE